MNNDLVIKNNSGQKKNCCEQKRKPLVEKTLYLGIDFGTTNCLISYYDPNEKNFVNNNPQLYFIENKKTACNFFTSMISIDQNGKYFFCNEGDVCKPNANVTKSIKRIIGLKLSQIEKIANQLPFKIDFEKSLEDKIYIFIGFEKNSKSVEEIVLGMMLGLFAAIKDNEKIVEQKYETFKAVITVPAYFDENARIIIKNAALLAGFDVLKLINEPTAAALSYMHFFISQNQKNSDEKDKFLKPQNYLVYDLGGGTFDISILKWHNNEFFRVIGIGGDKYLGGDDLDLEFANFVCQKNHLNIGDFSHEQKNEIISASKKFKEEFENQNLNFKKFSLKLSNGKILSLEIDRETFENIFEDIIAKTFSIMKRTLQEIDFSISNLAGIILVGGSSRLHLIKKKINELIIDANAGHIKILDFFNPDEVVASGAALYSLNLNPILNEFDEQRNDSNEENLWRKNFKQYFIDAISQDLGIEIGQGLCEILIPKNSPIPITAKQIFSTQVDNQKSVRISICQGHSNLFHENIFLGEFCLENLPNAKAGSLKIEVNFNIDCDGILNVIAKLIKDNQDPSNFLHAEQTIFQSHFLKIK